MILSHKKLHDFIMKNNLNSNLNMISDADDLEHVDIPSMDGSHHQPSTASLVSPITVGDDCAPNITNNL
ncbi:hypothetical protein EUTSA_v10002787mg [Eutrema salsugineum]|uniref:Uncharacterized protein n=1 Tax=Eutrema salsugineum TaxID=72664 RepID=V4LC43_EUTSA|nr:hypothetical protein EUTSA_v10002787mg [Eutrema salsugineum]